MFGLTATAFYLTYAIRELGAPEGESGWFTIVISVGTAMALFWGMLADRTNNRVALCLATVLLIVAPMWVLAAPTRLSLYPVIFLTAVAMSSLDVTGYNVQLEFSSAAQVPRYVALYAAVQFVPRFAAPLIGGAMADRIGFRPVFVMASLSSVASLLALIRMRDPRGRIEAQDDPAGAARLDAVDDPPL